MSVQPSGSSSNESSVSAQPSGSPSSSPSTSVQPSGVQPSGEPSAPVIYPADSGKTAPGVCGCGTSDVDTDSDGVPDCNDICPGTIVSTDDVLDADGCVPLVCSFTLKNRYWGIGGQHPLGTQTNLSVSANLVVNACHHGILTVLGSPCSPAFLPLLVRAFSNQYLVFFLRFGGKSMYFSVDT
jgi:hypothetical protein